MDVASLVAERVARSVLLASTPLLIAVPIAFLLGSLAAIRPGGRLDKVVSTTALLVIGLHEFVVGLGLMYFFAVWLRILPPNSTGVTSADLAVRLKAFVLPTLTLTLLLVPYILRMLRSSFRGMIATPYVQAAIARGMPTSRLLPRHVLPNTLGPVINVIALSLARGSCRRGGRRDAVRISGRWPVDRFCSLDRRLSGHPGLRDGRGIRLRGD